MATQWKVSTVNTVTIDLGPYDVYGESDFTLHYKLKGDLTTTDSGSTWTEIMHDMVSPISIITSGITSVGAGTIEVTAATGVVAGQVYQSGSVFFYVSSVSGTTITLRRLTETEIADATTFTQVGNTGIYDSELTLDILGQYTLLISNPSVGLLNEATKVEVVANTVDDIAGSISTESTGINTKLDDIQSSLGLVDTTISGKLII